MYLLDTDHLSTLQRGGEAARRLLQRLVNAETNEIAATIISYEEQTRGWLSYMAKARSVKAQVEGYSQLQKHLENYCAIPVLDFSERSAQEFQRLKKADPRLGSMDLKIAAIAIANNAILLSRNLSDFRQITGLLVEDWTV